MILAPIVIFAFNRPEETLRLIDSLRKCPESADSELFVFLDGARRPEDEAQVQAVRRLFVELDGFRQVHLFPSEKNQGLSRSVISGVSQVLETHETCIVLEDDLVLAPDFLAFMNEALEVYRERKDIFSISGYTPDIEIPKDYTEDTFLVPRPQCWGWATWRDRWQSVDWDCKDASLLRQKAQRRSFDRGGNDLSRTLALWQKGRLDVWAIRWVFSCWRQGCYTVNPVESKVQNGGLFSRATHGGYHDQRHAVRLSSRPLFPAPDIQPDPRILATFKAHHDLTPISKIGYFLRLHNLGYSFFHRLLSR